MQILPAYLAHNSKLFSARITSTIGDLSVRDWQEKFDALHFIKQEFAHETIYQVDQKVSRVVEACDVRKDYFASVFELYHFEMRQERVRLGGTVADFEGAAEFWRVSLGDYAFLFDFLAFYLEVHQFYLELVFSEDQCREHRALAAPGVADGDYQVLVLELP